MRNFLSQLPDEIYRKIYTYVKAECVHEIPIKVKKTTTMQNKPLYYRNLGSDPIRCKYLNDAYRKADKTGRGRIRELDYWKLMCDLERPIVWHTCILGWQEWFVRRYQIYAKDVGPGGVTWHSIYEPGKLTLAGWHRLTRERLSCYDTRAPIW